MSALDQLESLCTEHEIRDYAIPILSTRAQIARRLADYARARSLLEDALWLQERSGIPAHRAGVLVDLAGVLLLDGNGVEAAARYEQALEACRATGDRRQESLVRQSLGMLLEGRRDYPGALDEFDAAADLAEQGGERSLLAKARGGRGWILYRQGRFEEARKLLQPVADELEMLGEGEAASDAYDTLARVALGRGDLAGAESLLAAAERVLPLDAAGGIGRFESAGLRSRFVALGELAQDLAWKRVLAATDPASRDAAVRRGWQEAGAWKSRTVLEGLRTHGPAPASIDSLPGIERGSALIEYAAGEESLRAYVVGPDAIELLDLGPRQPIEIATRQLVAGLSERLLGFESFASEAFALHAKLLVPVLARLSGDTRTLVIVPTPDLAVLPFEALVTRDPGLPPFAERFRDLHYLIDEFAVVSAPSSPVFARLQSRPARTRTPRFLVLGDPVYLPESVRSSPSIDLALARPADSILDLSRLRGTAEESHRIAALVLLANTGSADADKARLVDLQGRRSGSLSTDRLDLRLGAEANPDVLRADLRGYTHLHIAAHGLVDSQDPRHSGLVFSWRPRDQGFTPLEDILDLRLDAELVVLSASDTARGRIVGGEGVQSLANAFVEAGARAVLASLWRLDDDDAAVLMKDFYERILRRGVPAVEAMRQAKLAFRRSGLDRGRRADGGDPEYPVDASAYHAHPHYWAPFLMVGAPPR
jgi:CHAT domain-containing protein/tetratricopeptide (TPR) repeat protein